jgi:hypothetical protein
MFMLGVDYYPTELQKEWHEKGIAEGGRASGKSLFLVMEALKQAVENDNIIIYVVSPDIWQSEFLIDKFRQRVVDKLYSFNTIKREVTLQNKSKIRFVDPNSLTYEKTRGILIDIICLDNVLWIMKDLKYFKKKIIITKEVEFLSTEKSSEIDRDSFNQEVLEMAESIIEVIDLALKEGFDLKWVKGVIRAGLAGKDFDNYNICKQPITSREASKSMEEVLKEFLINNSLSTINNVCYDDEGNMRKLEDIMDDLNEREEEKNVENKS